MRKSLIYVTIVAIIFASFTFVFAFFPRSTFSEIERRELAVFPAYNFDSIRSGDFTRNVSSWFSDSEPFRDELMQLHLAIKDLLSLKRGSGDDRVAFHTSTEEAEPATPTAEELEAANRNPHDYENHLTANAVAKVANAGIIIVGEVPEVRALMAYGGIPEGGASYAEVANLYKSKFGSGVNVYCMVVPTCVEFYCPEKVKNRIKPQLPTIKNIYSRLNDSVKAVDVYSVLGAHAAEDIYLRTDHHWSHLGAFYAARKFAEVARVPFRPLNRYRREVIDGFVGTMYGYSKDISVKRSPEKFVYYTPLDTNYRTVFINFGLDKNFKIVTESAPVEAPYFKRYKAKGMAYSTFMGGDAMIVKVTTGRHAGRRLAIIKDSFGNALPSFLFGSFDEIHVLDHRYFPHNMVDYVKSNRITDFLFVNNIFNAYSEGVCKAYRQLLSQK